MGLLIAIVILVSLFWGEVCAEGSCDNMLAAVSVTAILASLSPAFAFAQLSIAKRRHRKQNATQWNARLRIMALVHSAVWTVLSIVIAICSDWPETVQQLQFASTIPLANEMLLVAPCLFSFVASWAIFIFGSPEDGLAKDKSRSGIFLVWLRMQVLMVVAPIIFAFFVTDCFAVVSSFEFSPASQMLVYGLGALILFFAIVFYPQLMLFVWSTEAVTDTSFRDRCDNLFRMAGLRPRKVRIWTTSESVVNAGAVGIVPGTEVLVVTDLLLMSFSQDEVDAILLHEMGHVRHHHCIKRIAMVLIPLVVLAADQASGVGLHAMLENPVLTDLFSLPLASALRFLPAMVFLGYVLFVSRTYFRNMEFEADQFAAKTIGSTDPIESALEKMAIIYPQNIDRQKGLHPSIRKRLANAIEMSSSLCFDANMTTEGESEQNFEEQSLIANAQLSG